MSYTNGPWRLSGPDTFGDYTIQPPDDALAIAAVTNGTMRQFGGAADEHAANAQLIAAAPDLYEALNDLCELVQGTVDLTDAKTALAKARGEPQ